MTRRRLAAAALGCLVLGAVGPGVPSAAAAPGVLVLTGSASASVVVVLTRPARLDPHLLRISSGGPAGPDSAGGYDGYAGLAVHDASGALVTATVNVGRWLAGAQPEPPPPVSVTLETVLPRGRYRLTLLAGGPSRVEVPATGGLARSFAPTASPAGTAALVDLRSPTAPGRGDLRRPVALRPNGGLVLVEHVRSTAQQSRTSSVCFAARGAPSCADADGTTVQSSTPGSVGDAYEQSAVLVYGDGESRKLDALVQSSSVDVPRVHDALVLSL